MALALFEEGLLDHGLLFRRSDSLSVLGLPDPRIQLGAVALNRCGQPHSPTLDVELLMIHASDWADCLGERLAISLAHYVGANSLCA